MSLATIIRFIVYTRYPGLLVNHVQKWDNPGRFFQESRNLRRIHGTKSNVFINDCVYSTSTRRRFGRSVPVQDGNWTLRTQDTSALVWWIRTWWTLRYQYWSVQYTVRAYWENGCGHPNCNTNHENPNSTYCISYRMAPLLVTLLWVTLRPLLLYLKPSYLSYLGNCSLYSNSVLVICLRVNWKEDMACRFGFIVETDRLFKVTVTHIHFECGIISGAVQDVDFITAYWK